MPKLIIDRNVFSLRDCVIAGVIIFFILFAAYLPVTQGYYLANDDYWGFVYDYKSLTDNPMFKTQATVAGRPLGAFVMSFLQSLIFKISDANIIRGFMIFILSLVGFLFYLWLRINGTNRNHAVLIAGTVFTLPSFHSGIYCITDSYSIYGLLPASLSGFFAFRAIFQDHKKTFFRFCWYFLAITVLFLSLITYPPTAMFYWVMGAVLVVGLKTDNFMKLKYRLLSFFLVPVLATGIYFLYFKLSQTSYSYTHMSFDILSRLQWFFVQPFPFSLGLWSCSFMSSQGPNAYSITTLVVIVLGFCVACAKEIRLNMTQQGCRILSFYTITKFAVLLALFPLTALPFLFANNWHMTGFRYFVALMPLVYLSLLWSVSKIGSVLFVRIQHFPRNTNIFFRLILLFLCLSGVYTTHFNIMNYVVFPLSTELKYFKSTIRENNPNEMKRVHLNIGKRRLPWHEVLGFQTASGVPWGAWSPGLVQAAVKELFLEDKSFSKAASRWDVGYSTDAVTYSRGKQGLSTNAFFDEEGVVLIDMRKLEFLIEPFVLDESLKTEIGNSYDSKANRKIISLEWKASHSPDQCVKGVAVSGDDYPGFPASQAFDDESIRSRWASLQTGLSVTGTAYIGYDFGLGVSKHIRSIAIRQGGAISSVIVQRSNDGRDWKEVTTLQLVRDVNTYIYDLPSSHASRYWRLLANDNASEGPAAWSVYEIAMMELISSPIPVSSYKDYNFVRYGDILYGVPHSLGTLDLHNESDRSKPGIFTAENIDELKKKVEDVILSTTKPFIPSHPQPIRISSYKDYNFVRYGDILYGVPHSLFPLDFQNESDLLKPSIFTAENVDELKKKVDDVIMPTSRSAISAPLPPTFLGNIDQYNIVYYNGDFFGVPRSLGPLDLSKEADRKKKEICSAKTREELQRTIIKRIIGEKVQADEKK